MPVIPVLVLGIGAVEASLLLTVLVLTAAGSPAIFDVVVRLLLLSDKFSSSDDDESPESLDRMEQFEMKMFILFMRLPHLPQFA